MLEVLYRPLLILKKGFLLYKRQFYFIKIIFDIKVSICIDLVNGIYLDTMHASILESKARSPGLISKNSYET